jgi:hypothetical protein
MELNALQHIGGALKVRNTGMRSLNIAAVQTIGEVNDESLVITGAVCPRCVANLCLSQ